MNANELIDRYVHEVGKQLPRRGRADIEQELQSLLADTIEERGGPEPKVTTAVAVLREFGSPAEMAAQYHQRRHFIGPQLYQLFRVVITIMLSVMTVFYGLILIAILWNADSAGTVTIIWSWFTDYAGTAITGVGITTIIFAAIEYFYGDEIDLEMSEKAWDPLSLPPVNDPDRVDRGEMVVGLAFTAVFLSIFVALVAPEGALAFLIAPAFRPELGWLIASEVVDIVLNGVVLWQGRWRTWTRVVRIGADIFGLYVLSRVIAVPAIVTIGPLNTLIRFGVTVALIIVTIELIVHIGQLLWRREVTSPLKWRHSLSR